MNPTFVKSGSPRRLLAWSAAVLVTLSASASAQVPINKLIYHMMRRTSPGFTYAQYQQAVVQTYAAYLNAQLNYTTLPDVETFIAANLGVVNDPPYVIFTNHGMTFQDHQIPQRAMREARTYRRLFSSQLLYESTVAFWADHLNILQSKGAGYALFPHFHKNVTRKHALGQFRSLILASGGLSQARATAMLEYLDNVTSSCAGGQDPNENYAREVLELHIMGSGYTELEIDYNSYYWSGCGKNTSPIVPPPSNWGSFEFHPSKHCSPPAGSIFLGVNIPPNAGAPTEAIAALNTAIDYVGASGPVCKNFIAKKLVRRFLTDATPVPGSQEEAVLNNAAAAAVTAFGANGDISAMIQAILTSSNLDTMISASLYKHMPPRLYASSLFRAVEAQFNIPGSGLPVKDLLRAYTQELVRLAQPPFDFAPPIGYPESIGAWVQDQPSRWRFAYELMTNAIVGIEVDVSIPFAQVGGFNAATAGNQVNLILAAGNLSAVDELIIQRWVDDTLLTMSVPPTAAELLYLQQHALALGAVAPSYSLY